MFWGRKKIIPGGNIELEKGTSKPRKRGNMWENINKYSNRFWNKKTEAKDTRKLWEAFDMPVTLVVVMVPWMSMSSKLIKLYALNTCSSLYISRTSIMPFLK